MAGNGNQKIRGITIELDGDASGLMKSLSDIGKSLRSTQSQLNDVNKLLKLDPGNMELIAQKQRYLGEMTEQTAEKLEKQKEVLAQLKEQAAKGVDNTDQQNAMQREIIQTTKSLEKLKDDLRNLDSGSGVDEITEDMRDVEQSAERAAQSISEMDNAAEPAADSMQDMADAADKMQESIDEAGEALKSSAFMDASESCPVWLTRSWKLAKRLWTNSMKRKMPPEKWYPTLEKQERQQKKQQTLSKMYTAMVLVTAWTPWLTL